MSFWSPKLTRPPLLCKLHFTGYETLGNLDLGTLLGSLPASHPQGGGSTYPTATGCCCTGTSACLKCDQWTRCSKCISLETHSENGEWHCLQSLLSKTVWKCDNLSLQFIVLPCPGYSKYKHHWLVYAPRMAEFFGRDWHLKKALTNVWLACEKSICRWARAGQMILPGWPYPRNQIEISGSIQLVNLRLARTTWVRRVRRWSIYDIWKALHLLQPCNKHGPRLTRLWDLWDFVKSKVI